MAYWQLFYHFVWSTKERMPIITKEIEPILFKRIRKKAFGLGATVFALNGMPEHVHLVASVPPSIAVAKFIGQVKGVSSAYLNQAELLGQKFFWQEGYGVFSFDKKRLSQIIDYVAKQKEHHAHNRLISPLERFR